MKLKLLGLSVLLACASLHVQAVGRLADITIVDRDSGASLPVYQHRGEYWVAGRPGARYAVSVRNRLAGRVLAVASVDGVNVLSGETASWEQTGYVFSARQNYQITGWRKSDQEVAAFEFADARDSYAGRTGRPGQAGVIGVALFREQVPEQVAVPQTRRNAESKEENADSTAVGAAEKRAAAPAAAAKLGTAHGARESSVVSHTEFERQQARPDEIVRIRYDSRENLLASGVIPQPLARAPVPNPLPNPFPGSVDTAYAPDPPARR